MNFAAWIACWITAADCVGKALGQEPQHLLASGMEWLFWLPAAAWLVIGFGFLFRAIGSLYGYETK